MFFRRVAVKLIDGCCAGRESVFRGAVTFAKTWGADVTLLGAEEGFASATIGIVGLLQPTLTLVDGDSIEVAAGDLRPGEKFALGGSPHEVTIGGLRVEIKCLPLFALPNFGEVSQKFTLTKKFSAIFAALILAVSAGGVGIASGFSVDKVREMPGHRSGEVPALDFWSEVTQQTAERFAIGVPVIQRKLQEVGLMGFVELEHDVVGNIYTLSGQVPSDKSIAIQEFTEWHAGSGDTNILIDRVAFTDELVEQPPAISMVMGGDFPKLFFANGQKVRLGEIGPEGWLYKSYNDGIVILTRGGTQFNVVVFKSR